MGRHVARPADSQFQPLGQADPQEHVGQDVLVHIRASDPVVHERISAFELDASSGHGRDLIAEVEAAYDRIRRKLLVKRQLLPSRVGQPQGE